MQDKKRHPMQASGRRLKVSSISSHLGSTKLASIWLTKLVASQPLRLALGASRVIPSCMYPQDRAMRRQDLPNQHLTH